VWYSTVQYTRGSSSVEEGGRGGGEEEEDDDDDDDDKAVFHLFREILSALKCFRLLRHE